MLLGLNLKVLKIVSLS